MIRDTRDPISVYTEIMYYKQHYQVGILEAADMALSGLVVTSGLTTPVPPVAEPQALGYADYGPSQNGS